MLLFTRNFLWGYCPLGKRYVSSPIFKYLENRGKNPNHLLGLSQCKNTCILCVVAFVNKFFFCVCFDPNVGISLCLKVKIA